MLSCYLSPSDCVLSAYFRCLFRLLEVPFRDSCHYPGDILTAFLTPIMIHTHFTYPGSKSSKEDLPMPMFKAVLKVARVKLKGTKMTMEEFKSRLRQKFSSWKLYEVCIH